MLSSNDLCKSALFVFLFLLLTSPAHALEIEIGNEVYTVIGMSAEEGRWNTAVSRLKEDNTDKNSWKTLQGKANQFEMAAYSTKTDERQPASRKAELMAISDMANYIQNTGGQSYIDSLEDSKSSSYWGAIGSSAGEAVVRIGVPIVSLANNTKKVRSLKEAIKLGKDIVEIGVEAIKVGSDINAMAYGVALGHEYMTMAQEFTASVQKGKERINAGEVLNLNELANIHLAAQYAKAYGVMGSQIATMASTMNRNGFSDVIADHWGAIVSTCLGAASTAFSESKGIADKAKGLGTGAFHKDIFLANLKAQGVPGNLATNIVNNSDLIESMIKDTEKAMEWIGDYDSLLTISGMLNSGLDDYDDMNPNESIGEIPIFDDDLLAIYEQLFDDGGIPSIINPEDSLTPPFSMPETGVGSSSSYSSGPRLGDISIDSNVGDVTVVNTTRRDLEVNIHSVEATGRVKTGDITIKSGKGNDITVIKNSRKDESEVNIGSVKVGD